MLGKEGISNEQGGQEPKKDNRIRRKETMDKSTRENRRYKKQERKRTK